MNIATVLGARPQFIKAAPLSAAIAKSGNHETLIHTGQHYDYLMSQVFFDELGIKVPDVNLEVGSGGHGKQTGEMMIRLETHFQHYRPDWVVVFGDTNSTLAGAITASKLRIPLAHVESGLRSFNREMPEETNRVLSDHCSDLLFCPTASAANNLKSEGIENGVHWVGDTMCDAIRMYGDLAARESRILEKFVLTPRNYLLATVHRPYNTDSSETLSGILEALSSTGETVVFPVHPRARARIQDLSARVKERIRTNTLRMVDPVGYLDMLELQKHARLVLTDSGGVQKEAYMLGVPCITLRPETEWMETVESGWNVLAGSDPSKILSLIDAAIPADRPRPSIFGDGYASVRIVEFLTA